MSALETYLDFLETSSSSNQTKENQSTHRIDNALRLYRQRKGKGKGVESDDGSAVLAERNGELSYESRLIQLEKQLTELLTRSKGDHKAKDAYTTSSLTKDLSSCTDTDGTSSPPPKSKSKPHPSSASLKQSSVKGTRRVTRKRGVARGAATKISSADEDRKRKTELLMGCRSVKEDRKKENPSVQVLSGELDGERERRWKAEQAASRLVEHVKTLQSRVTETEKRHELTLVQRSKLERALEEERGMNETLKKHIQQLEDDITHYQKEKEEFHHQNNQQVKLLGELEKNYRFLEEGKVREAVEFRSRIRESEAEAAGHRRELEVVKKSLKQTKAQVQQLQELLATRETEHQKNMEKCRPLDGKEVRVLVANEVKEERKKMEACQTQLQLRLSEQQKSYQNLEDEFRMALRIEASRYSELEQSYKEVCSEVEATRETAVAAVQKEQRATAMVAELTSMVKEQRGKIREVSRSKQELVSGLKERVSELEAQVMDKNKTEARMISLQEDKAKLQSQVSAQDSVIEGLREERKLWGKELAHQGASLAQDRGRMEAQLDSLMEETKTLGQQLQRERDAVRVKEKQVDDLTHSLQQLKQSSARKEEETQTQCSKYERELQDLVFRLEQEQTTNRDIQDQLEALLERKEQLKEELASAKEEGDQWKKKFNKLKSQWEEKVKIIDSLEENLQKLQKSFSEKESQLVLEKEQAVKSVLDHQQRLKSCDDAFREQLETKEKVYHENLTRLAAQKNKEIDAANEKVVGVEEEMRVLLQEVAREKKNMEAKFFKLSSVIQDLQEDISNPQT